MPLGWFEWFSFGGHKEHKVIKKILEHWIHEVFSGITLGILDDTERGENIHKWIKQVRRGFNVYPDGEAHEWKPLLKSYEIGQQIQNISLQIREILMSNWFWVQESWKKTKGQIVPDVVKDIEQIVAYRAFIFWVLTLLETNGFDTESHKKKLTDVPDNIGNIIFDILRDPALSTLLVVLKSYGMIDLSENQINEYEVEEEVKILNINRIALLSKLTELWIEKVFEWVVEDVYYDYPEGQESLERVGWIKSTFRIRKRIEEWKTPKYFYTIKRKLTAEEEKAFIASWILQERFIDTRRCFEKELEIKDFALFQKVIESFGLVEARSKRKERISYATHGIKFDFDSYDWYNDMLEIEANDNMLIPYWLKNLWLLEHKRLVGGTRTFWERDDTKQKLTPKEKWNAWKRNKSSWNK